jgi:choline-sulfatase
MRRSLFFTSAAAVLLIAVITVTLIQLNQQTRLNVLLLTVESTRYDAISAKNTPFLWRQAKEGHRFLSHRTASAWTGSNIVSILTGLSTFQHGVHSRDSSVPAAWSLPLETLKDKGWDIGGLQSFMLIAGFQNLGLTHDPATSAQAWMAAHRLDQKPFFLWRHYLDTHLPYDPPGAPPIAPSQDSAAAARLTLVKTLPAIPASAAAFEMSDLPAIRTLYDAQFQVFDGWFKSLWTFLEKTGLRQSTIIVLTTDHGEELLERGHVGHASTTRAGHLHEEIAHIPLIIWLPETLNRSPSASTTTHMSSHLDIMPTIFELLGVEPTAPFEGQNLFNLSGDRIWTGLTSKAGFAEENPNAIREFIAAIKDGDDKAQIFLQDGVVTTSALYNLRADPKERHNLAPEYPERLKRLTDVMLQQVLTMRIAKPKTPDDQKNIPAGGPPKWIFPASSGALTYDDLPSPLALEWRGAANADYVMQYQAGEGILSVKGEINVSGARRDLGNISQHYWEEYVTPYKQFRLRIRRAGSDQQWGPWLTIAVGK